MNVVEKGKFCDIQKVQQSNKRKIQDGYKKTLAGVNDTCQVCLLTPQKMNLTK